MKINLIIFALFISFNSILAQNNVEFVLNNNQHFNFSDFESVLIKNNQGDLKISVAQYQSDAVTQVPRDEIVNVSGKPKKGFVLILDIDFKNHFEKLPISKEKTLTIKYTEAQSGENYAKDTSNKAGDESDKRQFDIYFEIPLENQLLAMEIRTGILYIKRLNETEFIGHFYGDFSYPDAPSEAANTTEHIRGDFTFKFNNTFNY